MSIFRDKIKECVSQEVFLKDINGSSFGGVLKEVGDDYCVLVIAKRMIIYNLIQIVSIEPRMQNLTSPSARGSSD